MIKKECFENIVQIHSTLLEISQVTDWLAALNAETNEINAGLSCILTDLRDRADHAMNVLCVLQDDLKAE